MGTQSRKLNEVSLITNNFGDAAVFPDVLQDWFRFIGGKPGEVVVVDCGSDRQTHEVYWQLFQQGLIDKLQMIQSHHEDNAAGVESGYIKEYAAAALSSKPYILWFHVDTLPYQEGHEDWLEEAITYLDREDVFAVGGSFNLPSKHHEAWTGWYFSHKCSLNFALMKRDVFMAAVHEFAGSFILSGFKSENPAASTNQDRFLFEVAFERYIDRHKKYTLCKIEDPTWTVFHTNTHAERLQQVRKKYLNREGVQRFLNIGFSDAKPDPAQAKYYGKPDSGIVKKLRVAFGKSPIGFYWRTLKQKFS